MQCENVFAFFWPCYNKGAEDLRRHWDILTFSLPFVEQKWIHLFSRDKWCIHWHAKFHPNLTSFEKFHFKEQWAKFCIILHRFLNKITRKMTQKLSPFFFLLSKLVEILHAIVNTSLPPSKTVSPTLVNKWPRKSQNVPTACWVLGPFVIQNNFWHLK